MAANRPDWRLAVQTRPEGATGFIPLRQRWVVERTNAWNGRDRRNSKDYERKPESSAAMIQMSNRHLVVGVSQTVARLILLTAVLPRRCHDHAAGWYQRIFLD